MGAHGKAEAIDDQTCYTCHLTLAGQTKLLGYIHGKADDGQPGVAAAATIYQIIIVVLVLGGFAFFIHKLSMKPKRRS